MGKVVKIAISLVLFSVSAHAATALNDEDAYGLRQEMPQIEATVQRLVDNYGVEGTLFVGAGNGPTAVIAMMQVMHLQAINLPQSNLNLRRLLPQVVPAQIKKIVLLDSINSSARLISVKRILNEYLALTNSRATIVTVAFSQDPIRSWQDNPQIALQIDRVILSKPNLVFIDYSEFSQYGQNEIQSRSEYDQLKLAIASLLPYQRVVEILSGPERKPECATALSTSALDALYHR